MAPVLGAKRTTHEVKPETDHQQPFVIGKQVGLEDISHNNYAEKSRCHNETGDANEHTLDRQHYTNGSLQRFWQLVSKLHKQSVVK